ncbi:MAG: porin [Acetobacteraceae bacterium]|nr:porin [Acetobacteraceae bacterium]
MRHVADASPAAKASLALLTLLACTLAMRPAQAQGTGAPDQSAPAEKPYVPPANLSEWASSIKLGLQGEGGIVVNTLSPDNHRNFGQLFTDLSNAPVLNQLLGTISRDVDPKATSMDIGFKLQVMYGSDARITHTLGVFDQLIHNRYQLDIPEASVSVRIPQWFANGFDIKGGIWPTPMGAETIDPKTNAFYTHSYIFNYGLPYKNTGFLSTAHVSDTLDLYLGVDTGVNTFLAYGWGDNNNRPGGTAGFGLNLSGGKLTVLALTHIGPEDSKHITPVANSALRYLNDIIITWKATDKLTLTGEANYIRDDGFKAEAYGAAGYVSYALNDRWAVNGRAEVYRDNNNFFVFTPVAERDFVATERGTFARIITASKPTTYSELTLGTTYKIPGLPERISTAMIRPEIRYDRTLNGSRPFGNGDSAGVVTFATDLVLGF